MEHHDIKDYIFQWMERHKRDVYDLSDYMWEHPELGLEEFEASSRIKDILASHGFYPGERNWRAVYFIYSYISEKIIRYLE